jgi:hypothetical protein
VTSAPSNEIDQIRQFVERMSDEQRMLVVLNRELYDGSWDDMIADLQDRLAGRPYIFKLANRIVDDLARIEQIRQFERRHGVNLGQYVKEP